MNLFHTGDFFSCQDFNKIFDERISFKGIEKPITIFVQVKICCFRKLRESKIKTKPLHTITRRKNPNRDVSLYPDNLLHETAPSHHHVKSSCQLRSRSEQKQFTSAKRRKKPFLVIHTPKLRLWLRPISLFTWTYCSLWRPTIRSSTEIILIWI